MLSPRAFPLELLEFMDPKAGFEIASANGSVWQASVDVVAFANDFGDPAKDSDFKSARPSALVQARIADIAAAMPDRSKASPELMLVHVHQYGKIAGEAHVIRDRSAGPRNEFTNANISRRHGASSRRQQTKSAPLRSRSVCRPSTPHAKRSSYSSQPKYRAWHASIRSVPHWLSTASGRIRC